MSATGGSSGRITLRSEREWSGREQQCWNQQAETYAREIRFVRDTRYLTDRSRDSLAWGIPLAPRRGLILAHASYKFPAVAASS